MIGNLLKTHPGYAVEELLWQGFYTFGHVQALICGKATYYRLLKRGHRCLPIGAIILHNVSFLYLLLILLLVCTFRAVLL